MSKKRTHKARVEKTNKHKSPEQIRREKCEKTKSRNATKKKENIELSEKIKLKWVSLSTKEKLEELSKRPGKSKKERKRIHADEAIKKQSTEESKKQGSQL